MKRNSINVRAVSSRFMPISANHVYTRKKGSEKKKFVDRVDRSLLEITFNIDAECFASSTIVLIQRYVAISVRHGRSKAGLTSAVASAQNNRSLLSL